MIDIKLIRESPDLVKENIKKKFQDEKLKLVDEVRALALLPSRQVLLGMLAGVLNAPIAGLARVLHEIPSGLARSLNAVADKSGK